MTKSILEMAQEVVEDRNKKYGSRPFEIYRLYKSIAESWGALRNIKFTPTEVLLMLMQLKICRENLFPNSDNIVDVAGYSEILGILKKYQDEEPYTKHE